MSNASADSFVRRHFLRRSARRRPAGGFTLLEMLIVIGIIALLISLLLPALARTRESARQAVCLNHLRQLTSAIIMYVNDNDGQFPAAGVMGQYSKSDWLAWAGPNRSQLGAQGIGPYLHLPAEPAGSDPTGTVILGDTSALAVLRCPSQDMNAIPNKAYPFSYVMNVLTSTSPWPALGGGAHALRQVKDAASKVLVYEEDVQTTNDAAGYLQPGGSSPVDLLAIRHDWAMRNLADGPTDIPSNAPGNLASQGIPAVPYHTARGNVGFCDGHAEFVARDYVHSKNHFAPDPTVFGVNVP